MRTLTLLMFIFTCSFCVFSQKTQNVTANYTLYASEDMSIEAAKAKALERAKIDAIETAFGSHVSQINTTAIETADGKSNITFSSYGGSEIRGEWIETTSEPKYDIAFSNNFVIVSVTVNGIIREIHNSQNDIEVKILRNGVDPQCESVEFYEGDEMYMSFISSSQGNLVVYLLDTKNIAYRLLPYRKQKEPAAKINDNEKKIFFSKQHVEISDRRHVDEYVLTTVQPFEINTIYVVFTPNDFDKAIDYQIDKSLPRELSGSDFHRWLAKTRARDNKMIVKEIPITIRKCK